MTLHGVNVYLDYMRFDDTALLRKLLPAANVVHSCSPSPALVHTLTRTFPLPLPVTGKPEPLALTPTLTLTPVLTPSLSLPLRQAGRTVGGTQLDGDQVVA